MSGLKMEDMLFWFSRKINYPLVGPRILQISLTNRCNLSCRMCSIANSLSKDQELSTAQILHAIDEAQRYGIKEVVLTGGEPFLREDLFEIAKYCHDKGLRSIITTNGTLMSEQIVEAIINSEISHLHFSIDGLEETNDYFRGPGAFDKIVKAVKLLSEKRKNEHFFSLGFACTVMDNNVGQLLGLVKLADNLNLDVINFQPLVKDNSNFLDKTLPLFWVKKENVPILSEEINKIRGYKRRHITVYEEPRLELLIEYYKGRLTKKDWTCFGGFKTVFICFSEKQPLIYSCHGICGNLDEVELKTAWLSRDAHKLRVHSKKCKELCLQSCYSEESSGSLINVFKAIREGKK
jgi:MoaA/NifB/PqqE/SkfB family radical SAM enzyme